jgi:hypothetical protein
MLLTDLTPPVQDLNNTADTLLRMSLGLYQSQALYVVAKLGIADLLQDGPKTVTQLAQLSKSNSQSLYLVLRALASVGIFTIEGEDGQTFSLTPLASPLTSNHPSSLRDFIIFLGAPWHLQVWGALGQGVKTGKSAFQNVFKLGLFPYLILHPTQAITLKKGMVSLASACLPIVLQNYDFSQFQKIVNLGGGNDTILADILAKYPQVKGVLCDRARKIKLGAKSLESQGVMSRCEIVTENFFQNVPQGGECYIMKSTIQDWGRERTRQVLEKCGKAMALGGKVILLEKVVPLGNAPSLSKWLDLEMLVMGRGRSLTAAEYEEFLTSAGWKMTRIIYTGSLVNIIEAVKNC